MRREVDQAPRFAEIADGCPDLGIPSCAQCPLRACRYDLPQGRARAELTRMRLVVLIDEGLSMDEAARQLGVNRRTAYRLWRGRTK